VQQAAHQAHPLKAGKCQTRIQQRGGLMNRYQHLTADERHQITAMRRLHYSQAAIAKELSRSPSTISRELRRNVTRHDGWYRAEKAQSFAIARISSQRRRSWFSSSQWHQVEALLKRKWSPEQVS